ncbi:hypothetical protein L1887_16368 [Cichorium endivia]|nr:hypothetical protein L1887_16368 [Cichorium endivia]
MTAAHAGDDLGRSLSHRLSLSTSSKNWASASVREAFSGAPGGDAFEKIGIEDDEDELKLAAIERLPTYERSKKEMLKQVPDKGRTDLENIGPGPPDKKQLRENVLKIIEEDNESFLLRLRERTDRVGIETPKIEVRYKNLSVEGNVFIGSRALPTLFNATLNAIEGFLQFIRLVPSNKQVLKILQDVSGIVRPSRMTLLLGPPSSGKTTFLKTLAGVPENDLTVTGEVTYCGHKMSEFVPQRTCAYISQHDVHHGEMTVRETFDFAGRCLGVGTRYDLLAELMRRERIAGIIPDPEIDVYMKATAMACQESSLVTDYVLKILGLDICADIMVGNEMRRGISGGQKKRVTTGEMLVGPAKPAPETFELFDDIILLSEGEIVYQGPRAYVLEFFENVGFKCPERKAVADFLQEVTSRRDQEQYWFKKDEPYRFISAPEFAHLFSRSLLGEALSNDLETSYNKTSVHPAALVKEKYGISNLDLLRVVASALGTFTLLLIFVFGGFIVAKDDIDPWMIWGYYASPMMYGQNAIMLNEFLDDRWNTPNPDPRINEPTVGKVLLRSRGMFNNDYMFWVCVGALCAYSLIFTIFFILALTYLNPLKDSKTVVPTEDEEIQQPGSPTDQEMSGRKANGSKRKGMVLPFKPLSLAFNHVNYYVDMPAEMKSQGLEDDRLQLLRDVSGAFRPGILTALVGVSGAGKTTLMDVLAGRKTGGYIEGNISISGYPKNQETFARVSGYCEQNDIHSPHVTVYESLVYSAWLRLPPDVTHESRYMFVEEVMNLIELDSLRNSLVGLPGVDGLSTEQRKRLTIAVELVANPCIIFMDEPTSGLDARAAAIVMRTVRNTVDTGRTVVCTIHQPSIDIFEAFDELLLMKRGGQVIYAGSLGHHSDLLIEYFQSIPGVTEIKDGQNPATWMLEVSSSMVETQLGIDFAATYANSELYRTNQELIKLLSKPALGSQDLHFKTKYSQSFFTQFKACFWKQRLSYWRHPQYNVVRFLMTTIIGIIFGIIFWGKGQQTSRQQDLMNMLGAMYAAVMFLGGTNTSSVQAVVSVERTVFYREKAAGMYSPLPYAFAQVAIEVAYVCIQTFIYSILLFLMIGFAWSARKFFLFYFFVCMCFTYFTLYGMMLVALTPNYHIAAITMSFFLSFWNLFSGFLIPRTQIPIWWRWYYWGSPVAWTLYGLITSQVGENENLVEVPGAGSMPVKVFIKDFLGYNYDFLPYVAMAHVLWAILFFIVFACGIKFLNFQKR